MVDNAGASAAVGSTDPFALTSAPKVEVLRFGREGELVVVVDGLFANPEALVELVANTCSFTQQQGQANFYPGVRSPAPQGYLAVLSRALGPLILRAFPYLAGRSVRGSDCMSLVTLRPEALNLAQRVPHVDTDSADQIALLHYLCDGTQGGTGFYRHRSTGFETITPERSAAYYKALEAELQAEPPPLAYVDGSTPLFEEIGAVEARFNRLVFYRSRLLHSGKIGEGFEFSPDPRRGRLTGNAFLVF